jgi:hypothetical protein
MCEGYRRRILLPGDSGVAWGRRVALVAGEGRRGQMLCEAVRFFLFAGSSKPQFPDNRFDKAHYDSAVDPYFPFNCGKPSPRPTELQHSSGRNKLQRKYVMA